MSDENTHRHDTDPDAGATHGHGTRDAHVHNHHHHDHEHRHAHDHHGHTHDHRRRPRRLWWGLAAAALIAWVFSGVRMIETAERGVVQRFGKVVNEHVPPGIHPGLPLGIERMTRVAVRKTRRVGVGVSLTDRTLGTLPDPVVTQFLSGDRNIVDLQLSVQYAVADVTAYVFDVSDPTGLVRRICESAVSDIVRRMSVDEVLTLRKAEVQLRTRDKAQKLLDRYRSGIQILSVSLERASPPEAVADAFRDVTSARADKGRKVAEAEGYRDDLLPRTRGEVERILSEARADAFDIVQLAEGRAERFESIRAEAAGSAGLTRQRLHAETMEQVLNAARKVLVPREGATDVRFIEEQP